MGADRAAASRPYSAVAIVLHWAIAAAIVFNLALGLWMQRALSGSGSQSRAIDAFQTHKSLGLTVLALSLMRLAWRLLHRPPPALPMPAWQQRAASLTHGLFYCLMLALPLSGWLYVSTQWRDGEPLNVTTLWFGLFEVPHLFGLNEAARSLRAGLAEASLSAHQFLAWSMLALLVLHVGAALKHQFVDRDGGLMRMLPLPGSQAWRHGGAVQHALVLTGYAAALTGVALLAYSVWLADGVVRPTASDDAGISSPAGSWIIQPGDSHIRFSGTHAGADFQGRFTRWSASLSVRDGEPAALRATVQTGSATDGVSLHDSTLKESEWFNVAEYPEAVFTTERFQPRGAGRFEATGRLTLKSKVIEPLQLTLMIEDNNAIVTGDVVIDRKAANLGMESDPNGRWVSMDIPVSVRAVFKRP